MRRLMDRFVPDFLQDADHYLLINYPHIWATKIHYLLFFVGGMTVLALFQLIFLGPELSDIAHPKHVFGIMMIPFGLAGLIWLWKMNTFRVEKRYGETRNQDAFIRQLLIFTGLLAIVIGPLLYTMQYHNQAQQLATELQNISDLRVLIEDFGDESRLLDKVSLLNEIHTRPAFWQKDSFGVLVFCFLIGGTILYSIFSYVGMRLFLLTLGLGFVISFALAFITSVLQVDEEIFISLCVLFIYGISVLMGLGSNEHSFWPSAYIAMASGMTIFVPFFVWVLMQSAVADWSSSPQSSGIFKIYLLVGAMLAPVIWHMLFRPRLIQLNSMPRAK